VFWCWSSAGINGTCNVFNGAVMVSPLLAAALLCNPRRPSEQSAGTTSAASPLRSCVGPERKRTENDCNWFMLPD